MNWSSLAARKRPIGIIALAILPPVTHILYLVNSLGWYELPPQYRQVPALSWLSPQAMAIWLPLVFLSVVGGALTFAGRRFGLVATIVGSWLALSTLRIVSLADWTGLAFEAIMAAMLWRNRLWFRD